MTLQSSSLFVINFMWRVQRWPDPLVLCGLPHNTTAFYRAVPLTHPNTVNMHDGVSFKRLPQKRLNFYYLPTTKQSAVNRRSHGEHQKSETMHVAVCTWEASHVPAAPSRIQRGRERKNCSQ